MMLLCEVSNRLTFVGLRQAGCRDGHNIWRWNNGPEVRRHSLSTEPIDLEDHEKWFAERLYKPGFYTWIAEADDSDVGVVRIDIGDDGIGTVSIAIDPSARGRGIGRQVLRCACTRIEVFRPGQILEAWIAEANDASRRCFEACGFVLTRNEQRGDRNFGVYRRENS